MTMKYYTALLLSLIFVCSSCFEQDYTLCTDEPEPEERNNLVVLLDLKDGDGGSLFAEKITSVDVFLYNSDMKLIDHRRGEPGGLGSMSRFEYTVFPGTYYAVCWANVDTHSAIRGASTNSYFWEPYVETVSQATGSPLYYAPEREVTDRPENPGMWGVEMGLHQAIVNKGFVTEKEMLLRRVHRNIKMYLRGYRDYIEVANPSVQLTTMPCQYDFYIRTYLQRKAYQAGASDAQTSGGVMPMAAFDIPIASVNESSTLNVIRQSDVQAVASFSLKSFMDDNAAKIRDMNEISILITFASDGSASIGYPGW